MLGIFHNNVVMYAYSGTKIILMYIINIINILQPELNNHTILVGPPSFAY